MLEGSNRSRYPLDYLGTNARDRPQNKKNMVKKNIFSVAALYRKIGGLAVFQLLFFCPQVLLADNDVPYVEVPTNVSITGMLGKIRGYFFGAVIAACVFMVLWGGFDLATSGGDETKVKNAKNRIMYASIGLIVAALSMGIVSLIMSVAQVGGGE